MPIHHFISYSTVDGTEFALKLADALTAGPPSYHVWLDRRHLEPGREWDVQLAEAIRDCEGLLFVLTRDSVEDASTCKAEWTRALKYKKPITPLLLHRDAELPFRMGSRQYIDFSGDFETGLAKLRRHLEWLRSPAGALQALRDRLADAQRDLRRATDADRPRIQDDIELLTRQIADQERIAADPDAAARRAEQSIAAGLERERQPERPIAGRARTKFINPPPGAAPSYFQDRAVENELIADFLREEGCRLMTVVGRAGVGKTALVCRLLKALEAGHLPDDLGSLRPDGIVYLSATGTRRISVPNLFADLCKLLPDATAAGLDAVYRNPQASTEAKLAALLAEFPRTPQTAPDDPPAADRQPSEAFSTGHKARLLRNLEEYFDEEELRSLAFDLDVKYGSLPAQGTAGKARELIAALGRTGRLHELVERGRHFRPNAPWGDAAEVAGTGGARPSPDRPEPPPTTGTIVLLDNFEDLVDPATQGIHDAELDEALRALLNAGHHAVKVILTTRVAPRDLALIQPGRQCRLELDEGLPSPFAENILREMDRDGKVGLKTAAAGLLDRARVRTRGYPRALEALYGILSADRYTTLEEVLDRAEHYLPENVVAALVGEAFNRLDPTGQRVMQALAVYARPVTPPAVDYLLQPALPGLDSAPVLGRLVNMHFARREAGKYYLHPVDRAYAFERIPDLTLGADLTPDPSPVRRGGLASPFPAREGGRGVRSAPAWGDKIALRRRAADYFKQARKPRADWKTLDDLAPQLAEFDLRCAADDYDTAARVLVEIDGNYLLLWGYYRLTAEQHERLQGKLTNPRLKMISLSNLGHCYYSTGQIQRAIACYERALALAREAKDRQGEGVKLGDLGNSYADLGQTTRAIEYIEQALVVAREIGNRRDEGTWLDLLGTCYADLGQTARAIACHEQALAGAREIGDRHREGMLLGHLGNRYAELGQTARAIDYYEQALDIAREIRNRRLEGYWSGYLAEVLIDVGHNVEAIQKAQESVKIGEDISSPTIGSLFNDCLAWAYFCADDLPAARIAAEAARRYDAPLYNHRALARLSVIALRQGDQPAAREAFAAAVAAADVLLAQTPELFDALDAKGLACCGLALCDVVGAGLAPAPTTRAGARPAPTHLDAAVAAYRAARAVNRDAGIVGRALRLLDALAAAHGQGAAMLAPARAAAAAGE
jgi:tetratricopeptide (TPR) repeat protein